MNPGNLRTDLEEFFHDHRPHGPMTGDATEPAWNGYLLTVTCPCGVVFERWVSPRSPSKGAGAPKVLQAQVLKVIDGDTIKVTVQGRMETVR